MVARQVRSSGRNIIGTFPSLKTPEAIPYESTIERDYMYFLEFDSQVVRYQTQPFRIITQLDDKQRSYVPDFLISYKRGPAAIIECKPEALLQDPEFAQQKRIGEAWALENQCEFRVKTDKELRQGPRLANLQLLWKYARKSVPTLVAKEILALLSANPMGLTIAEIIEQSALRGPAIDPADQINHPYLYHLLFRHTLTTNLDLLLRKDSLLMLTPTTE